MRTSYRVVLFLLVITTHTHILLTKSLNDLTLAKTPKYVH